MMKLQKTVQLKYFRLQCKWSIITQSITMRNIKSIARKHIAHIITLRNIKSADQTYKQPIMEYVFYGQLVIKE